MRKIFVLFAIAATTVLASCGGKGVQSEGTDSVAVDSVQVEVADTVAVEEVEVGGAEVVEVEAAKGEAVK